MTFLPNEITQELHNRDVERRKQMFLAAATALTATHKAGDILMLLSAVYASHPEGSIVSQEYYDVAAELEATADWLNGNYLA